jgi:hypothetical protein
MKKKLLAIALLSTLCLNTSFAQNVNYVQQREELLAKKSQQNIKVGWFAGILGEYHAIPMTQSFLPLSVTCVKLRPLGRRYNQDKK